MDVILITPRGHGGRLRECLDWLQHLGEADLAMCHPRRYVLYQHFYRLLTLHMSWAAAGATAFRLGWGEAGRDGLYPRPVWLAFDAASAFGQPWQAQSGGGRSVHIHSPSSVGLLEGDGSICIKRGEGAA